jgi:DNA polymerase-4
MERKVIHLNVPNFPVAVERVIHPELRMRPVVVAPPGPVRSMVTAVSPEAWTSGIRPGMPVSKAVRYCRSLVVLPPNEMLYMRASRALIKLSEGVSPVLEPSGNGQIYLDVTGTDRLSGPARDTAWKFQREISCRLHLDTTFGIASNKMVSRIASVVTRPVGLQDIPQGEESSFLFPLPVRLLPGVGARTEGDLNDLNIRIIRDVALMKPEQLVLVFGRFGFILHQRANGIDPTPVYPMKAIPALEQEKVLPEDSNDYELLKAVLRELCEQAGFRLRQGKKRAGRLDLRVRYADCGENSKTQTIKPPMQSSSLLYARGLLLLSQIVDRRTRVRSMRLRLKDLSSGSVQLDLFPEPRDARRERLESALDTLRFRGLEPSSLRTQRL